MLEEAKLAIMAVASALLKDHIWHREGFALEVVGSRGGVEVSSRHYTSYVSQRLGRSWYREPIARGGGQPWGRGGESTRVLLRGWHRELLVMHTSYVSEGLGG